jgi:multicomponent Na+:H+ antiporter subunit E
MMKHVFGLLILILLWIVLSGQLQVTYLFLGFVSCLLSLLIINYLRGSWHAEYCFSFKHCIYFIWLLKEICLSAIRVTLIIWSPKINLNSGMQYIKTHIKTQKSRVLYACSISLTPGTFTIELNENRLLIHSLDQASFKDLEYGPMEVRIRSI